MEFWTNFTSTLQTYITQCRSRHQNISVIVAGLHRAWGCACIIFPSAPLHTFNWQASVNKTHTLTQNAKQNRSQNQRGGCTFTRVPPLEYCKHQSHIVLFVFQLAPAANQLYKSARARAEARSSTGIFAIGRCRRLAFIYPAVAVRGPCSSFQCIKQINKPPHLHVRASWNIGLCGVRASQIERAENWYAASTDDNVGLFSAGFCPVDEKASWVFCAQTESSSDGTVSFCVYA